jgi:hypothetical protein
MTHKTFTGGGWMIEVVSSGLGGRRRRYLVAIADRAKAIDLIINYLGPDTDITSAVSVSQEELEVAKLEPGKFAPV